MWGCLVFFLLLLLSVQFDDVIKLYYLSNDIYKLDLVDIRVRIRDEKAINGKDDCSDIC